MGRGEGSPGGDLHADATAVLGNWRPAGRDQEALRQAYLGFLAGRPDACRRSCEAGHITASALVLDATGERTLLTLHPRVGRWLQLGGHCEASDVTLAGAALREATEESGIRGLRIEPTPIHLDVHPITCSSGVPTRHFDVRFLVRAPVDAQAVRSAESVDLQWWPLDAMPSNVDDLYPMVEAALARLR
ncbi:8-oxo-dGTP pyrophosphatase MutT (NUDIX family) [Saccharothrix tamanrassetensis]|uniref:8-oxo-dGTP pyrophosphatase MutT (NUDIX family) n=1 Tax=Saccharothrix tamanrassetensis TaxID=1051531 RepID=A0A841CDW0_9PSEU|nr:NUDIX hydrolase [Saccharothrix tamanrassetensis]MBB5955153.1 8-oxo-dGTP pyrophosphatase MutT (NUDIX family) [Saccharothrix tamanrassetensis]